VKGYNIALHGKRARAASVHGRAGRRKWLKARLDAPQATRSDRKFPEADPKRTRNGPEAAQKRRRTSDPKRRPADILHAFASP